MLNHKNTPNQNLFFKMALYYVKSGQEDALSLAVQKK